MQEFSSNTRERSQLLTYILPILTGCFCILFSVVLIVSLHYHPYIYWNIHVLAWGCIGLVLTLAPHYLSAYAPMLVLWAFWFSLQGELAMYWKLIESGAVPLVAYSEDLYFKSVLWLLLSSLLQHIRIMRTPVARVLLAAVNILVVATVPKPKPADEFLVIQQVAAYVLLYLTAHVVCEVYAMRVKDRTALGLAKLLYSSWVLWSPSSMFIIFTTSLHTLLSLFFLLAHYNELYLMNTSLSGPATAAPTLDEENSTDRKDD